MTETKIEPEAQPENTFSLQDLNLLVTAVDLGSKAGAFSGGDMEVIGAARNRVQASVQEASQKIEAAQQKAQQVPAANKEIKEEKEK